MKLGTKKPGLQKTGLFGFSVLASKESQFILFTYLLLNSARAIGFSKCIRTPTSIKPVMTRYQ